MKIDDPQLLVVEQERKAVFASHSCRALNHPQCTWVGCECSCHRESTKQLNHEFSRSSVLCATSGCYEPRGEDSIWCKECSVGRTPGVRLAASRPL